MKVSIVIPNYNGEKYIEGCLSSLKKQSFKDYEVLFVDNASCDQSIEIAREILKDIIIIQLDKNYGFSKAVNEGIKASKGEYVVLLNNDTTVQPNWLYELVRCIGQDEKIFSCCSKMIQFNHREKIDDAGDQYIILGWAYKCGDGAAVNKYNKNRRVFSSCAGAAIYRKRILDEIGYFDENFFAYMEDVDISYRANIHGYRNIYCSNALVYHIGSASSGSRHNRFKVKLASRNNIYLIIKNMPLIQLILNLPFLILGILIKYLYFIKKGLGKEYKLGVIEAVKSMSKVTKTKFRLFNLKNYIYIEVLIIFNTIKLIFLQSK